MPEETISSQILHDPLKIHNYDKCARNNLVNNVAYISTEEISLQKHYLDMGVNSLNQINVDIG